jgi:tetratricopeptide (TPR) repeat protein
MHPKLQPDVKLGERFTLLRHLEDVVSAEDWLALDVVQNTRVRLRIYTHTLSSATRDAIDLSLRRSQGLIHPNIQRPTGLLHLDDFDCLPSPWVEVAPFSPESWPQCWPQIKTLLDTLVFAHELGRAHGDMRISNIRLKDDGEPLLLDFGLPPVARPALGHPADDIHALGVLLYPFIFGMPWSAAADFTGVQPVAQPVIDLVQRMLATDADQRPDIRLVRATLGDDATATAEVLVSADFRRQEPASPSPALGEPAAVSNHRPPRERHVMSATLAFSIFAVLVIAAGAFFYFLPDANPPVASVRPTSPVASVPASQSPTADPVAPVDPVLAPFEVARQEKMKVDAAELARVLVRKQVELEDRGVMIWAPAEYETLRDRAVRADERYRVKDFEGAVDDLKETAYELDKLVERIPDIAKGAHEDGANALEAGYTPEAMDAYGVLIAIDASDEEAIAGLARAEILDDVLALVTDGEVLEGAGDLRDALALFKAAAGKDSLWQPAANAVTRVTASILERDFQEAMTDGFASLLLKDYDTALAAFDRANDLRPDSPGPADGQMQVQNQQLQDEIESLRTAASVHFANEAWNEAIESYNAALALDASLTFASKGIHEAESRIEIEQEIRKFIVNPSVLLADDELASARKTLATASRIEKPGKRMLSHLSSLNRYIGQARIPVMLQLMSDERTEVTINRVRHLGRVEAFQMELFPGTYTIVGKRSGYRDVQHKVTLLAGRAPAPIFISCTDKI